MLKQNLYKVFYLPKLNFIFRNILYPFRSILPAQLKIPVSGIIRISVGDGTKIKFLSNETSPMTKILFWEDKGCTFEYSVIFKQIIKESHVFFDIGANVGYYTLLAKKINPSLNVYAFEPSIGPKYFLNQNIKLNQLESSINVIEKALGNSTGLIDFYEEKNPKYSYQKHHASGIGNTANTWGITNFLKYNVDITTIDNICQKYGVNNLDLIKIDTEGTENLVLEGGFEFIKKCQPIIICEVLKDKIEDEIQRIIVDELDYEMYQYQSISGTLKYIKSIKEENANGETNYFFIPRSKRTLINSFI